MTARVLVAVMAIAAIVLTPSATARADDPVTLEIDAPQEMTLGEVATIGVVIRDSSGAPLPRASLVLEGRGSFLSTDGAMRLGEGVTDAQGRVAFPYQARTEDPTELTVRFTGDGRHGPVDSSVNFETKGTAQLYTETAGVRVPGVGVWLLAGLLGGVWSTYFAVMVFLTLIARAPTHASIGPGLEDHRG